MHRPETTAKKDVGKGKKEEGMWGQRVKGESAHRSGKYARNNGRRELDF